MKRHTHKPKRTVNAGLKSLSLVVFNQFCKCGAERTVKSEAGVYTAVTQWRKPSNLNRHRHEIQSFGVLKFWPKLKKELVLETCACGASRQVEKIRGVMIQTTRWSPSKVPDANAIKNESYQPIQFVQAIDHEWIQPKMRGWRMKCCDCGLVHRIDFRVRDGHVEIKPSRDMRATAAARRKKKGA